MVGAIERNYVCTPYFCRRNSVTICADNGEAITVSAEQYDFFAVVMGIVIEGYTLFDDRCITNDEWQNFLLLCSAYLSQNSLAMLLNMAEENDKLKYWLRINGYMFWEERDSYKRTLQKLLAWSAENTSSSGMKICGI